MSNPTRLYSAVGPTITHYAVDAENCLLRRQESIDAPDNVHYAWPDAAARMLYIAGSNAGPYHKPLAPNHYLAVCRIDPGSGALRLHQGPVALKQRPVHLCLDVQGSYVLVGYPGQASVSVHRILDDGSLGDEVPQPSGLDFGVFVHQVRVLPSNRTVIAVTRGNDALTDKPEDPGALKVFDFSNGVLRNRASIAPRGGYGFGPRHIDFDPQRRWVYAALERQNELQVFALEKDDLRPEPLFVRGTLGLPRSPVYQLVGTVHAHPNGRYVYVANRASGTVDYKGGKVFAGGENSIAVFAIDQRTGEPTLIQNADTRGLHVRCFAIDPTGRMLVAANMTSMPVRYGEELRPVPAGLSAFRIAEDGRLEFAAWYEVETGQERIFWMGMVAPVNDHGA